MLRLIVLLTAVVCVCGNACRLVTVNPPDSTDSPGCTDSDGNLHEFDSEWGDEDETCVCSDSGITCCERSDFTTAEFIAESTVGIVYDYFGAFTDNDHGEPEEELSISDEEQISNQPDSSDSPEVIVDPLEVISDSHEVVSDSPEVVSDST